MVSNFDYDKAERNNKLHVRGRNVINVESDKKFEERLKKLNEEKSFDKNKFDMGVEFYNSGLDFEEAPLDLKESKSFKSGYEFAKRKVLIQEKLNSKSR